MASTLKSDVQEEIVSSLRTLFESPIYPDRTATDDDSDPDKHPAFRFEALLSVGQHLRMGCSAPALIDISRICYCFLSKTDNNIQATISPECLDYYATAMLWFRFITLKHKLQEELNTAESEILSLIEHESFSIPEPILMQLRIFGTIVTPTGDFVKPVIFEIPDEIINGFGGYYGPITLYTHMLYEEIPCLGVLAEAVRNSTSEFTYSYTSSLNTSQYTVNENLLGFKSLGPQSYQSKKHLNELDITLTSFPEYPKGTGLNMGLISHVSRYLAQTKTFKVRTLTITSLPQTGSLAQLTIQHVVAHTSILEKHGNIAVSSVFNSAYNSVYGLALVYIPQLMKGMSTLYPANIWCCVNTPRNSWITNRNVIRTKILHKRYTYKLFFFEGCNADVFRMKAIRQMLLRDM